MYRQALVYVHGISFYTIYNENIVLHLFSIRLLTLFTSTLAFCSATRMEIDLRDIFNQYKLMNYFITKFIQDTVGFQCETFRFFLYVWKYL